MEILSSILLCSTHTRICIGCKSFSFALVFTSSFCPLHSLFYTLSFTLGRLICLCFAPISLIYVRLRTIPYKIIWFDVAAASFSMMWRGSVFMRRERESSVCVCVREYGYAYRRCVYVQGPCLCLHANVLSVCVDTQIFISYILNEAHKRDDAKPKYKNTYSHTHTHSKRPKRCTCVHDEERGKVKEGKGEKEENSEPM